MAQVGVLSTDISHSQRGSHKERFPLNDIGHTIHITSLRRISRRIGGITVRKIRIGVKNMTFIDLMFHELIGFLLVILVIIFVITIA